MAWKRNPESQTPGPLEKGAHRSALGVWAGKLSIIKRHWCFFAIEAPGDGIKVTATL
jgi:hypothetical protein